VARHRTPTPRPRRQRTTTLQTVNTCEFCGLPVQVLVEHPRPVDYERSGSETLRENCIVTPRWRWCCTLKEIDPPDGEVL